MATPPIPVAKQVKIKELVKLGLSDRAIAKRVGVHHTTVLEYRHGLQSAHVKHDRIEDGIRATLKRGPLHVSELAGQLGRSVKDVRAAIAGMKQAGALLIQHAGGHYELGSASLLEPGRFELRGQRGEWTHHFGVTSDNHLCNRHSRLDVLRAAYNHFAAAGIRHVFNAGNWIDGEARFNKTELVTAPGMDNQLDYMIDKWPAHPGIVTHFIAGDDHEGWYAQREGIEIGQYLQDRANRQGRADLHYLGYGECDVALLFGAGAAPMRVVHPGGGSAYAISYTDQKRVESYQGGEKPRVELVGHYHKWNYGFPREVHTVQVGCTCDQTMFMRKKRLQAHVGFAEIKVRQDAAGIITRFAVEWFPFFDRGFYERRFR